jgi:hypothetical protein
MAKKLAWYLTPLGLLLVLFAIYFRAILPNPFAKKEGFVSKSCPDGTRSDGPCLLEFPSF